MADVEDLVLAMTVVYPAMRRQVMFALASLSDREYQTRVWIRHEVPDGYGDDFSAAVHVLYDDCQVLPDPNERVDWILLQGEEVARLTALGLALTALIDRHGDVPDTHYLADARWDNVVMLASDALACMVRGGHYC